MGGTAFSGTTVLFDWNGTLVLDSERARAALNDVLERRGLGAIAAEDFSATFRLPFSTLFAKLGVDASETDAAEAEWNAAMASTPAELRAETIDGLLALAAGGCRLGIVSAADAAAVDFDRSALAVPDVWSAVETGVVDKLAVLRRLRGDREHAYYVGDTPYDMECAAAAGYQPIGVSDGYARPDALRAAGASAIVTDLAELVTLLTARKQHLVAG